MAFASGQVVTAAMLNRITPNVLTAACSANVVPVAEVDITGMSISVTTPQANTKIEIAAVLDVDIVGTDFSIFACYINGTKQSDELNRGAVGRWPVGGFWVATIAAASTFTVKITGRRNSGAGTTTVFSTHSKMKVSGNGIS